MAADAANAQAGGGLGSDALKELWCWLWAGIAERELRIWRDFSRSRDLRSEKQVCVDLLERLLDRIPAATEDASERLPHVRLGRAMDPSIAAEFEAELRTLYERARSKATPFEVGGNNPDAMARVLDHFLPLVGRLRATPHPPEPASRRALGPVRAFRFHTWLATTIDQLEEGASDEGCPERSRWREELPHMRMVLAQWVASLPSHRGSTHDLHNTWDRLRQGLDVGALARFAGWLAEQARDDSDLPPRAREALQRALLVLAEVANRSEEALRRTPATRSPPWRPPDPLPIAFLGNLTHRKDPFTGTVVEDTSGLNRDKVPFHQFLATLDRFGSPPPSPARISPKPKPPPPGELPETGYRLVEVSLCGVPLWRVGEEPLPSESELAERTMRILGEMEGEAAATPAKPLSSNLTRPVETLPTPRCEVPPSPEGGDAEEARESELPEPELPEPKLPEPSLPAPPKPAAHHDWSDRVILSHPGLHRALVWIMMAGAAAGVIGLLYIFGVMALGWDFTIPYVGELLMLLVAVGLPVGNVLPEDADGMMIFPPPRAPDRKPGARP
jgi:hypothetical protein